MGPAPSLTLAFVGSLLAVACPGGGERVEPPRPPVAKSKIPEQKRKPAELAPPAARALYAVDPQPLFRTTTTRSGRTAGAIPRSAPKLRWRFATSRPIAASPILDAAGTTYIGSLDGSFSALDAQGRLLWRRAFADAVHATAALVAGGVVVGADDDHVRRLDRGGKVLWSLPLGACPLPPRSEGRGPERVRCDADSSAVIAPDGTIVVGGDALYALHGDGRIRWRLETGGHVRSSPALGPDGTIYVGTQGGALLAVSAEGKKRWERRELYDFDSSPALTADGLVVVGCDDGRLYGLGASDGALRFRVATRGPVRSSPALAPDGTILFGSDDGQLRALSSRGAPRWSFATGGAIRSSPAVDASGAVVFGSGDDTLYALGPDGRLLWSVPLGGDVDSSVALAPDGLLLVGCDDGALYAFGP